MKQVGAALPRREDWELLTGKARFMADLDLPDLLEAVVVRSPYARALINEIDASAALSADGVVAVLTATALRGVENAITRQFYSLTPAFVARHEVFLGSYREPVLAQDRVTRVGEPVALVIASSRLAAEDAAELVSVDYDPLEPIVDAELAMQPGQELVDPQVPGNVQSSFRIVVGDPSAAFEAADRTVEARFRIGRSVGSPIENRGVMAAPAADGEPLKVWSSTQIPHVLRSYLAEFMQREEDAIRVIAPDMGGSFGGGVYPEEMLVPFAADLLERPVRWLEDRRENLGNARHSRDQVIDGALAYDLSGSLRGLRLRIVQDCGSANLFGLTLPFNVASHARGQFAIDDYEVEGFCVLTNKTRNTPVRGAGRPEATFVLDRLVDMAAGDLDMDPALIRSRNLIPAAEMPRDMGMLYRDGAPMVYDSGDFPDQLQTALDTAGYEELLVRRSELKEQGVDMGIGISSHVEATGLGPHEGARVALEDDGTVVLTSGSKPHGQSHATTLAQVVGDVLGLPYDQIVTHFGDTGLIPKGGGTFGSRSAVTAGTAAHSAAEGVLGKLFDLAAEMLECDPADLVAAGGLIHPVGAPSEALTFAQLAQAARLAQQETLDPGDPALEVEEYYTPPTVTFGSGTHIATVVVDRETGTVDVQSYLVVADSGTVLNPMVLDGQQHGGVVHGVSNMLLEHAVYDDAGQLLTGSFLDYLLATSADVPDIEVIHRPHPTPLNPLGVKGAGEGSTASAPAAVANAIVDALHPLKVDLTEMPISPSRLVELIHAAERSV